MTSLNKMQLQNITRLGKLSSSLQAGSYKHFIPCHLNKLPYKLLNIEFKKAELISNSFLSTLFNMMNDLLQHLVGVQFFFTFC